MFFSNIQENGLETLKLAMKKDAIAHITNEILDFQEQLLYLDLIIDNYEKSIDELALNSDVDSSNEDWDLIKSSFRKNIEEEEMEKTRINREILIKKRLLFKII